MKNIKFYYLGDEYEPKIIFIDEYKKEAFSIDEFDLASIEKIEYPTKDVLNDIVITSTKDGYDGTWDSIKFILDKPDILEELVFATNREKYILSMKNDDIKEEILVDTLIERLKSF